MKLEKLYYNFCSFLIRYESIDIPGFESEPTTPIIYYFIQESKDCEDDLIVLYVDIEDLANDWEVVRVEPIKEQVEVLVGVQSLG